MFIGHLAIAIGKSTYDATPEKDWINQYSTRGLCTRNTEKPRRFPDHDGARTVLRDSKKILNVCGWGCTAALDSAPTVHGKHVVYQERPVQCYTLSSRHHSSSYF